jgi:hypothetical protein
MPAIALTPEQAIDIFTAFGPYKTLAHKFDVGVSAIADIKTRRTHRKATAIFDATTMNGLLIAFACVGRPL